jgi:ATP-binding cassette subfamily F protein 3
MPIATGVDLAKGFGAEQIFTAVSFEVQSRDRIALVGANGSGKTTLLRIVAGLERPDRGTLNLAGGTRVGYLPQEVSFPAGQTLNEYMLGAYQRLFSAEAELRTVEAALGAGGTGEPASGGEALEALLERHARLLEEVEFLGGYSYHSRMREVLAGLGIGEERLEQHLTSFSGGQRTRVALARLLLSERELLLLDEPTNHLDLEATEWLEEYLAQASPAVIVVSHDRYFLDRVAARTWEMEDGRLEAYNGNYTRFAEQKVERLARQQKEFEAQQEHIERTEAFVRRYKAGQRSRQARGRQKHLDRLERTVRPREQASVRLQIQSTLRSGDTVLATEGLAVAAGLPAPPQLFVTPGQPVVWTAPRGRVVPPEDVLFRAPDVEVQRGDRIAIVGPNGAGKTTFLRVMTGETEPAAGRLYIGYGVQQAYYAQAHEQLTPGRTVLQEIQATSPLGDEAARTYLGRFLFSNDDAFKTVKSLSGGERSRLALAKMALGNANLLVLDEPTNHLDIYSRAALEDVLSGFAGTVIFVSHDRYLIDALATHVWEVADGTLTAHRGGWAEYLAVRERRRAAATASPARGGSGGNGRPQDGQRDGRRAPDPRQERVALLDREIAAAQAQVRELDEAISAASDAGDGKLIADLGRQHVAASETLARHEEEWLALVEEVGAPT